MVYDDGDKESLDLSKERYKVLSSPKSTKKGRKAACNGMKGRMGSAKKNGKSAARLQRSGRADKSTAKGAVPDELQDSDVDMAATSDADTAGGDRDSDDDFGAASGGDGGASSSGSESLVDEDNESASGSDAGESDSDGGSGAPAKRKGATAKRGRGQGASSGAALLPAAKACKMASTPAAAPSSVRAADANADAAAVVRGAAGTPGGLAAGTPATGLTSNTPRTGQLLGRLASGTPAFGDDAIVTPGVTHALRRSAAHAHVPHGMRDLAPQSHRCCSILC